MPASGLVREGKLTGLAWVYAAVAIFSVRFAVYHFYRDRYLLGAALLVAGVGNAYFIWAAWKKSKAPQ